MVIVQAFVEIANILCGMPLLYAAMVVAVVLLVKTGGLQLRRWNLIWKQIRSSKKRDDKSISSFSACCMALGNTLGVGNIAGVAVAIAAGGPGALFWLWVADALGIVIKYAEAVLGVVFRERDPESGYYRGGILWYIEKGLGRRWKWMAVLYAVLYCISDLIYPATQMNAVVTVAKNVIPIPPVVIAVVLAVFMAVVIIGGVKRLSEIANKVIPFMAVLYFLGALVVILSHVSNLPAVFCAVIQAAFQPTAAIGGFGGATMMTALRNGIARGFYSSGAGSGDAAFSHATADVAYAPEQGMWAMVEVLVDMVVCTCTALVILSADVLDSGLSGSELTTRAFATVLGEGTANVFISIVVLLFAFTTAVVSVYYGELCLKYVLGSKWQSGIWIRLYRIVMCLSAVLGGILTIGTLWGLTDFFLAVCMFICLFTLFRCRNIVAEKTREYVSGAQEK